MDQIKIGKLISERRRATGLTQVQLAERLGITDKAVSKWERGIAMPDCSIMKELCSILGISVDELLSGERASEDGEGRSEELLISMARELSEKNKTIWTSMWVMMISAMVALFLGLTVAAFLIPEGVWQLVVIILFTVLFMVPCFYALKLEVGVGSYRCRACGHEFVPTYSEALKAMHMGTTRHLKCPKCEKRTWCKKVIKK